MATYVQREGKQIVRKHKKNVLRSKLFPGAPLDPGPPAQGKRPPSPPAPRTRFPEHPWTPGLRPKLKVAGGILGGHDSTYVQHNHRQHMHKQGQGRDS